MDSWIDVPAPHPAPPAVLIAVEATAPAAPLTVAHGRVIEQPLRKLASFVATDGPRAAMRKARAKRAEPGFTGDLHLVVALGRDASAPGAGPLLLALDPVHGGYRYQGPHLQPWQEPGLAMEVPGDPAARSFG